MWRALYDPKCPLSEVQMLKSPRHNKFLVVPDLGCTVGPGLVSHSIILINKNTVLYLEPV